MTPYYYKIILWIILPVILGATDLKPWFSKDLELQPGLTIRYQHYDELASPYKSVRYRGRDGFYTLHQELSALDYSGEFEYTMANTRKQRFYSDSYRLTGRYRLLNDVVGDPVSLVGGFTIIRAFKHSLQDLSSFHHGKVEGEIHAAVGKEASCGEFWTSRRWGLVALGMADEGWPWLRTHMAWEKNCCGRYQLGLFMETLWGFGKRNIHRGRCFKGYGPINHQSVDIGFKYSCQHCYGQLNFEVSYRAYARNFPKQTTQCVIRMIFPLSPADWLPTQLLIQQVKIPSN